MHHTLREHTTDALYRVKQCLCRIVLFCRNGDWEKYGAVVVIIMIVMMLNINLYTINKCGDGNGRAWGGQVAELAFLVTGS